jgi:hypothetical protein
MERNTRRNEERGRKIDFFSSCKIDHTFIQTNRVSWHPTHACFVTSQGNGHVLGLRDPRSPMSPSLSLENQDRSGMFVECGPVLVVFLVWAMV